MTKLIETPFLTYDDVLLRPGFSEVLPSQTQVESKFSKNIKLNIPIVSAAMDTVTEAPAAIVLAQQGGIGVIHKNMAAEDQAMEVLKVKKSESGMILNPITVTPDETLKSVVELRRKHNITGVPVVDENHVLVGIITNRDMRFETNFNQKVKEVMTTKKNLIIAKENVSKQDAKKLLKTNRIEKLPVVDKKGVLKALITIRDIENAMAHPNANKDGHGRLRVAGAIGVGEKEMHRAACLVDAGVDALVIDTAHGHSAGVIDMIKKMRKKYKNVDIVAGNVATEKACIDLIAAGVDGIKVGIGPGSICTTRVVAGVGVPQMSAVMECRKVCEKAGVPYIADGGIKYSGDIIKALAAGASSVMIGSLFAGCDETPGEMILYQGRSYKVYRGMGSMGAMALGSKDRYGQAGVDELSKLVPEGVEGQVPYRGSLASTIFQLVGGLRAGMGYVGAPTLTELKQKAEFITITAASLKENHPHDVIVTKEAPNYSLL